MTGQHWATSRPYSDARCTGGQRYHRPTWGLWHLWLWRDTMHTAQAIALTSLAAAQTGLLAGVRLLQQIDRGAR